MEVTRGGQVRAEGGEMEQPQTLRQATKLWPEESDPEFGRPYGDLGRVAKAQALGAGWNTGMVMRDQIIPGDTSSAAAPRRALKFEPDSAFQLELRRRVDEYFRRTGRRQRDCWQMYLKTAIILAGLAVSYLLLVFAAHAWWQGVPLAVLLGFAAAGIGFNVQHDGGHDAYSEYHVV